MIAKATALILASLIAMVFIPSIANAQNETIKANITNSNVTLAGNVSGSGINQSDGNATMAFDKLANSTAILEQKLDQAEGNDNTTIRADIKASVSDILNSLGQVGPKIREATAEHLQTLRASAEALVDGIQEILPQRD
jgi:hypothetical protein